MEKYNPKKIEQKWQKIWEKSGIYKDYSRKKNFYALDMFPYISGSGIHVGHPKGYIATDVVSRYKMLCGYSVLHPMGWDAFGLPAENYAIKNKLNPSVFVKEHIKRFKKQLEMFGFTYDWDREFSTTDPDYYKWTQWIFLKMFEKGLAYESDKPVNWCSSCKTVLANEDLEKGLCERCGAQVVQKKMRQWVLKMTDYADRLLYDLDKENLDWEESILEQQRNWIGRSEGTEIEFRIKNYELSIKVYTTRLDTIYGCTYCVVAPEHPMLQNKELRITNYEEVEKYIIASQNKTELERLEMKEKTGVEIKGIKAINPFNNEEIPIFVADYVLGHYGTGAVMAVPAHDERDFEFAIKNNLPIRQVVQPKDILRSVVVVITVEEGFRDELKKHHINFEIGLSRNKREHIKVNLKEGQIDDYINIVQKYLKQDAWVEIVGAQNIFIFKEEIINDFLKQADEIFKKCKEFEPLVRHNRNIWEMLESNLFYQGIICYEKDGILIESGKFTGLTSEKTRDKMTAWLEKNKLGKKKVNYKMRDWVFSRQRYWGEPIPIIHCAKCGAVGVLEKDLPVKLPAVRSYEPTGTGESPLANIKKWVNTKCPKCGGPGKRETNTMPQWAGSSWYYLRYIDNKNNKALVNKKKEKEWMPVDLYVGGAEHATRHLLYARFWHKFLYDIKAVSTKEPFKKLVHVGLINAKDGRKMSKRWNNVINPDNVIKEFGADSLRMYEMFMGPFTQNIAWSTQGVVGIKRFLERVWKLRTKIVSNRIHVSDRKLEMLIHKTIKKVTEDIENFRFNTAISAIMILVNEMEKADVLTTVNYKLLIAILSSFAPHIAEELWESFGGKKSIFLESWPKYNPKLIKDEEIELVIQVNGKVRDTIRVSAEISEEEAKKAAMDSEKIKKWTEGKEIKKLIFVKGRLVNVVI